MATNFEPKVDGVSLARLSAWLVCALATCPLFFSTSSLSYETNARNAPQTNARNEKTIDNDMKADPPLPNQASGEEVWKRVVELLKVPHGLIGINDIKVAFGDPLYYLDKDSTGYTASSSDIRNKNYYITVIYLYHAMDKRYLTGPQSTVQISLPASDCLTIDRVEKDLLSHGMHFIAARSLPSPPSRIYVYPDNNGSIEVLYDFVRDHPVDDLRDICVKSLTVRGHVKSS